MKLFDCFANFLIKLIAGRRSPDEIIGTPESPYMNRWTFLPKNRFGNVYLHQFMRSDDDRALHDHPWISLSVVLKGRMAELLIRDQSVSRYRHKWTHTREFKAGDVVFRRADMAHRIWILPQDSGKVWTLFFVGPKIRDWGFLCPNGWRHWREFAEHDGLHSKIGRGCD